MNVTACLITYKRQYNVNKIVDNLLKHDFIGEIIIRDNSRCENIINYGRYTSAAKAENDIIYTQDDDCIVRNIEDGFRMYCSDPQKVLHMGTPEYEKVIPENIYGDKQMAMFGWGAFFDRRWMGVLDKYINVYGKDYCFYRETDRIFTMLLNKHHNFLVGDIEHLDGETDEFALCKQDNHVQYKKLAIERCLSL